MNGKFLLRIEDTDLKRSKSSLTEKIINDIKWLNIPWDEEIVFQQQNQNSHKQVIDFLLALQKHISKPILSNISRLYPI